MPDDAHDITLILQRIAAGDRAADGELLTILYAQLRGLAQAHFRGSGDAAQTLQPTALVHEAFVKLFGSRAPNFANREHFLAVAASAMRSILVDRARARATAKRGGSPTRLPLDAILVPYEDRAFSLVDLDDALQRLAIESQQAAKIIELRFFGGLEEAEIAHVLGIDAKVVARDWRTARAWLRRELSTDGGAPH
ncbi:MAG: ECF-type sigma factor [Planctomycetota bacterium]|nr:ECF-type sigma factor [Planctomycetota bacterium]